ncbi:thioredoxin domain-containing protein [Sphingobacterium sp. UT-1RO-CII-1]|uniref:TlpA family protein disulfide reductase n=1 Tax=Sphingobacterium sp. UT-1RO-CII-1 TaxID=2995225 RepID=UPI00227CA1AC|nr:thioredoxin domain-containing protein [Sphingobacterium sp. UT-1RO-CII-1]MCY4780786.1 thioredoxin domain-containing protein [Sphingobacterium sp. UT-1RO-CII-1]
MMRFLRKGDRYALSTPIKNRYYLFLNSFQCLLLSLSTIYYQFSCNVQESRARGTTGYGVERDNRVRGALAIKERLLRITRRDGRRSAAVLLTIFCVLFSFASVVEAQAQEPRQGGATAATAYNFENFEDKIYEVDVKYTYDFRRKPNEFALKFNPEAEINRFPLVAYKVDYSQTPNLELGDSIPSYISNVAFRYVNSSGEIKEGTIAEFADEKLLIIDFWATWCAPCVRSVDAWNEIAKDVDGVKVLAVMLSDYDYKALYFGRDRAWDIPIVFGPQSGILNSFFFDRPVISRMAWIKDGRLIAFTGTKGYDLQLVKDVLAGRDVEIPMNLDYTYTTDKS